MGSNRRNICPKPPLRRGCATRSSGFERRAGAVTAPGGAAPESAPASVRGGISAGRAGARPASATVTEAGAAGARGRTARRAGLASGAAAALRSVGDARPGIGDCAVPLRRPGGAWPESGAGAVAASAAVSASRRRHRHGDGAGRRAAGIGSSPAAHQGSPSACRLFTASDAGKNLVWQPIGRPSNPTGNDGVPGVVRDVVSTEASSCGLWLSNSRHRTGARRG